MPEISIMPQIRRGLGAIQWPCIALLGLLLNLSAHATVLNLGNSGEPQTLDPHRYNLRLEETLLNDLFMGLTTFDAEGQLVPGAAASWQVSEDGLVWTFHLRDDLKWSDGTALTADDFVYSFRRLQNPDTAASLAYFMYMLKNAAAVNRGELPLDTLGVKALGPQILELTLERPYPYLLERLLYPTAFPVPRHVIERYADQWVKPEHWVSNGAYRLTEWRPQGFVHMQRNPYFVESVAIDEVRYYPVVSEQSAYNRFRSGELMAIAAFPVGELPQAREQLAAALQVSDLLSMMYLVFNTERAPFDDVRVRQALSMAIDQRILTDKVMRSGARPAYSFVPALIKDYQSVDLPHATQPLAERQQRARQLLAEAGFDRGSPLRLVLKHMNPLENKKVNLAISGLWKQIGVETVLQQAELKDHFTDLRQGDFEVAWAGWIGENNPEHYLTLLQSDIGNVNYGRFHSAAYDAILADAQSMAGLTQRNQRLHEAERLAVDAYAVVPLYTSAVLRLVSPRLQGWSPNLRDVHQVRYLQLTH